MGSAVENAAEQARTAEQKRAEPVSFQELFLSQQDENEDDTMLGELLVRTQEMWPKIFQSKDVAAVINGQHGRPLQTMLRECLFGENFSGAVSPMAASKRLLRHVGNMVRVGDSTVALRVTPQKEQLSPNFGDGRDQAAAA